MPHGSIDDRDDYLRRQQDGRWDTMGQLEKRLGSSKINAGDLTKETQEDYEKRFKNYGGVSPQVRRRNSDWNETHGEYNQATDAMRLASNRARTPVSDTANIEFETSTADDRYGSESADIRSGDSAMQQSRDIDRGGHMRKCQETSDDNDTNGLGTGYRTPPSDQDDASASVYDLSSFFQPKNDHPSVLPTPPSSREQSPSRSRSVYSSNQDQSTGPLDSCSQDSQYDYERPSERESSKSHSRRRSRSPRAGKKSSSPSSSRNGDESGKPWRSRSPYRSTRDSRDSDYPRSGRRTRR